MMPRFAQPTSLRTVILAIALPAIALACRSSLRTGTTIEPAAAPPPIPVPINGDGTCPPGLAACPGAGAGYCFDLQASPAHCGTCDNACPLGTPCENGRCRVVHCTERISVRMTRVGASFSVFAFALADFDRDGVVDFLAPTPTNGPAAVANSVTVFHGNGDGTFVVGQSYLADTGGGMTATADINGDQVPDLVLRPAPPPAVPIPTGGVATIVGRLGNGDGSFGPEIGLAAAVDPSSIALADLDGDGKVDLALVTQQGAQLSLYRGHGDGSFSVLADLPIGVEPANTVTVADWSSDGIPDVVVDDGYIHVVLGTGQGRFAPVMHCVVPGVPGPYRRPTIADFDRDGVPDLVRGNTVLFGLHGCNATRQATYRAAWPSATPLAVADLNGDGIPDIAFDSQDGTGGLPAVSYLPADGQGGFGAPVVLGDIWDAKDKYSTINPNGFAADANGDGRLDLLVANQSSIIVFLNTCM